MVARSPICDPARTKSSNRETEEQGTVEGVFFSTHISRRVSINLALDPSTLCFHGSDTCILQKTLRMIEYDSNAEELERMMAAVGGGSILKRETEISKKLLIV